MIIYIKVYILLYKLSYKKMISNYFLGFYYSIKNKDILANDSCGSGGAD